MQSEPQCECNNNWLAGLTRTIFDYRNMVGKKCKTCLFNMWQDAYIENMYFDLKEMNS